MKNNDALYEKIMLAVSKEVKRKLSETEDIDKQDNEKINKTKDKVKAAADKLCKQLKASNKDLSIAIGFMEIVTGGRTGHTEFNTPAFKKNKYEGVPYSELIPELKERLKKSGINEGYGFRKLTDRSGRYHLVGIDGNAFSVMGYVTSCMKEMKMDKQACDEYRKDAMSGDYNHLLVVSIEMVDMLNDLREEQGLCDPEEYDDYDDDYDY